MRLAWLLVVTACGARPAPPSPQPPPSARATVPRLPAPRLIDSSARGAAYLTTVALSLQPAWHQFLEDCRLRLAANHPLNQLTLAATVELAIATRGEVGTVRVHTSGNLDFDQAIHQVIKDAAPLPPPPRELASDDDHVHLVWTFARDRRQAGPATARIVDVELPLRSVVERRIGDHELARAARRILRAPPSQERALVTEQLMVATLREALAGSNALGRRTALDTIAKNQTTELASSVRPLLTATGDVEMRIAAIETTAALGDERGVEVLVEQLRVDLRDQPRLAVAEARALVAMGHSAQVASLIGGQLDKAKPNPNALSLLAVSPIAELARMLPTWLRSTQVNTRAAVCTALAGYPSDVAWPLIERGLRDRDASVRATCAESAYAPRAASPLQRNAVLRLRELAHDRDSVVRARAVTALARLDPLHLSDASTDASAEVRAAFATAMTAPQARDPITYLRALIEDRDADVRAAAWTALASLPGDAERGGLATRASTDVAPSVRRAAVRAIEDDAILLRLAKTDEAAEVRTAALIQLASRRGRAASTDLLLERLAEGIPGSGERVRTATAWLLAR